MVFNKRLHTFCSCYFSTFMVINNYLLYAMNMDCSLIILILFVQETKFISKIVLKSHTISALK